MAGEVLMNSGSGGGEKQRSTNSRSKDLPIYLHFLSPSPESDNTHGFYYVIEERGDSPALQYPRPLFDYLFLEEERYVPLVLDLDQDEGEDDGGEDEEDHDDNPIAEAEKQAAHETCYNGHSSPETKLLDHKDFQTKEAEEEEEEVEAPSSYGYSSSGSSNSELLPGSDSDSDSDCEYNPYYKFGKEKGIPAKKKRMQENERTLIELENYCNQTKEGAVFVIYNSETDIIKPFKFPDLPFVPSRSDLLVVGERFYLLNGFKARKADFGSTDSIPLSNMFCWDSSNGERWMSLPGPEIVALNESLMSRRSAVWAAGVFFAVGNSFQRLKLTFCGLSSPDAMWKKLPTFPSSYVSSIDTILPLAVNGSNIFFQVDGHNFSPKRKFRNYPVHLAAYFDVKSCTWEVLDSWFPGRWFPGVVLYDDYFFSYGSKKPDEKQPAICIYSIRRRCWLRRPIKGLKRDGNFLPDDRHDTLDVSAFLFQINDDTLAFVWSRKMFYDQNCTCDVHCTKFIVHSIKDPRKKHPVFRAEVTSYGNWLVEGFELQNCSVPLNMEARVKHEGEEDQK